jgi:hypothetical protein
VATGDGQHRDGSRYRQLPLLHRGAGGSVHSYYLPTLTHGENPYPRYHAQSTTKSTLRFSTFTQQNRVPNSKRILRQNTFRSRVSVWLRAVVVVSSVAHENSELSPPVELVEKNDPHFFFFQDFGIVPCGRRWAKTSG